MNIVFSGLHGTGKSTIAKKCAEALGWTFYSTGMAFRELAQQKGKSLEEFSQLAETNHSIDKELDEYILELAKSERNYVFDGQLPAYLLKELSQMNLLLQCDNDVRIRRMMDRDSRDFAAQKHETEMREKSEQERFIEIYNIDIADPQGILQTYDLIVNTTQLSIEDVYGICYKAIKAICHL